MMQTKITLPPEITHCVQRALDEDIGTGDATSKRIIPPGARLQAQIIAKQDGMVAGLDVAGETFRQVDANIRFEPQVDEGQRVVNGDLLAVVSGPASAVLTAERVALNFIGRMSGIATITRQFAEAVAGNKAVILDTRKTAPGLRLVDKLAVRRGGGQNHRMGLYDMILIKENHIDFAGSLPEAVHRARKGNSDLEIEVETRTLEDVQACVDLGVERILLDNMTLEQMRAAVELVAGRAKLEASGNVDIARVRQIADTGVDYISIGALTHSVKVFDVSMKNVVREV
jgi:nicotinate-nucleotide pyrophosphorylase (carboxylating)